MTAAAVLVAMIMTGVPTAGPAEPSMPITVHVPEGLTSPHPVTGGVPLGEGWARPGAAFRLQDTTGTTLPVQTKVLGTWADGSARWVLIDAQVPASPAGAQAYTLTWGESGEVAKLAAPVVHRPDPAALRSGPVWISAGDRTLLNIADRFDFTLALVNTRGETCLPVIETTTVEPGDMKGILELRGAFPSPAGERLFQFRLRATLYAGGTSVRLEPMIFVDAESGVMQQIRSLSARLRPRGPVTSCTIGGQPAWSGKPDAPVRLFQVDDRQYRFEGADGRGRQAPGWVELTDDQGTAALGLRDFWQQWPKSIEVSPEGIAIGLLPAFRKGDFDHMEPWYKHQYLFEDDHYRIRTGQARRWDLVLDLSGGGKALEPVLREPLVLAADPERAIATGVWGPIAPGGIAPMRDYDPWAAKIFDAYCHSIEVQRDYGAMNWGDWFGERTVNWGNHEYDTVQQIQFQFARTGDPRYLRVADAAARHSCEVDTVHFVNADLAALLGSGPNYPPRPGLVHQHTVGHVSGFYSTERIRELFVSLNPTGPANPYLCLDAFNLGHIWTQGSARQYFLTGDPFFRETVQRIGENLARLAEDRKYKFMGHTHCGRTTGWPLLALSGAYDLDRDPRFLKAMRLLVDDAIAEQDPVCGGWLYTLPADHCNCKKARHVGMAGFITAILINGLSEYYHQTGDERLPKVIARATTYLTNDTWQEQAHAWRYTSCPASPIVGQPGVVMMAYVNAVRIAKQPEHRRILELAWDAKFRRLLDNPPRPGPGNGKTFSSTMYGCPHVVGLLQASATAPAE